jgi:hypothetical protein
LSEVAPKEKALEGLGVTAGAAAGAAVVLLAGAAAELDELAENGFDPNPLSENPPAAGAAAAGAAAGAAVDDEVFEAPKENENPLAGAAEAGAAAEAGSDAAGAGVLEVLAENPLTLEASKVNEGAGAAPNVNPLAGAGASLALSLEVSASSRSLCLTVSLSFSSLSLAFLTPAEKPPVKEKSNPPLGLAGSAVFGLAEKSKLGISVGAVPKPLEVLLLNENSGAEAEPVEKEKPAEDGLDFLADDSPSSSSFD